MIFFDSTFILIIQSVLFYGLLFSKIDCKLNNQDYFETEQNEIYAVGRIKASKNCEIGKICLNQAGGLIAIKNPTNFEFIIPFEISLCDSDGKCSVSIQNIHTGKNNHKVLKPFKINLPVKYNSNGEKYLIMKVYAHGTIYLERQSRFNIM